MGSCTSLELKQRVDGASDEQLRACLAELDADAQARISDALAELQKEKQEVKVRVESLIGNEIGTFDFDSVASIENVKDTLCSATNTPLEHRHLLKLVMCGNLLNDEMTLCACGIDGSQPLILVKESGARLGVLPDFCGFYVGENSEGGGAYVWEMVMDSAEFIEVPDTADLPGSGYSLDNRQTGSYLEGVLHWRLMSSTSDFCASLRARKFVKGMVRDDGSFDFVGYKCEPVHGLIAEGKYSLHMSATGDNICGTFRGPLGNSDGEFQLHRKDNGTATEWRKHRKEDILSCQDSHASEVRIGNQKALNLQL